MPNSSKALSQSTTSHSTEWGEFWKRDMWKRREKQRTPEWARNFIPRKRNSTLTVKVPKKRPGITEDQWQARNEKLVGLQGGVWERHCLWERGGVKGPRMRLSGHRKGSQEKMQDPTRQKRTPNRRLYNSSPPSPKKQETYSLKDLHFIQWQERALLT